MANKSNTIALAPWTGGYDVSNDPIVLGLTPQGQQQLTKAQNIIYEPGNGIKKRGGQAYFNSAVQLASSGGTAVDGIFATTYWRNNSANVKTEELIVVAEQGRMFYGASYGTLTALTFSGVTPSFSQGVVSSEVISEKLFVGYSKSAPPLTYSGGGANVLSASASTIVVGTFPNGWLVRQHLSRLFVAGDSANPDRLYYSASELPFAFGTAGGFIDIFLGDGDPEGITAIFPSLNVSELYVAKRSAIYKIITSDLTPSNWSVIPVSRSVGCVAHNSVAAIDQGDIFFASDRGIHSLQQVLTSVGIIEGKFISKDIQPDFNNFSNKKLITGIWAPDLNSYLFSCQRKGKTQIEGVYGYNIIRGGWFYWIKTPANFLFKRLNTTSEAYEYYSCMDSSSATNQGYISKLAQTNLWDFSSSTGGIEMLVSTAMLYAGGNIFNERNFLNVVALVRSRDTSDITVSYSIDEFTKGTGVLTQQISGGNILGTSSYLLGSSLILGSATGAKPLYLHIGGVGSAIQVTLKHDTIGKSLEVYGLGVEFYEGEESHDAYRSIPS